MLFNSLHFLIFFPLVVSIFFTIPHRFRWILLLAASYYFYMAWEPAYGILILISTIIDYFAAIWIQKTDSRRYKRLIVYLSLVSNLGILFVFKYFNFFFETLNTALEFLKIDFTSPALSLLLPVGISFYTFQSISYTLDVYRGTRAPERHFGIFALYVSFFPQLVAGPIERSARLIPQLHAVQSANPNRITSGLRLMLWGFFKKVVVADNTAHIADAVFSAPGDANGIALAVGAIFFAIQLYADFSGYTDIARGSARVMGYDLMLNFKRPYGARSISEFWNRWHISLTSWFQDYVFKPLYLVLSHKKTFASLPFKTRHILSFTISSVIGLSLLGLWHGASFNFILFGLSQALFIVSYQLTRSWWDKLPFPVAYAGTASMVLTSFIFFRTQTVSEAFTVIGGIITEPFILAFNPSVLLPHIIAAKWTLNIALSELLFFSVLSVLMFTVEGIWSSPTKQARILSLPRGLRLAFYYVLIGLLIFAGDYGGSAFIYFQF